MLVQKVIDLRRAREEQDAAKVNVERNSAQAGGSTPSGAAARKPAKSGKE
jgi:hypothetical protein